MVYARVKKNHKIGGVQLSVLVSKKVLGEVRNSRPRVRGTERERPRGRGEDGITRRWEAEGIL